MPAARHHAARRPPLLPLLLALLAACALPLSSADVAPALAVPRAHARRRVCPRGLAGPACDQLAWPACVVGALRIACDAPAPCACFAQCAADFFLGDELRFCYATNESTPPRSILEMMAAPIVPFAPNEKPEEPFSPPEPDERWGDPEECPQRCHDRGICTATKRCASCFKTLAAPGAPLPAGDAAEGDACEELGGALKPCIHDTCSGHGECQGGVCVCAPGHGGAACELPSLVQARGGARVAAARPAIFIYNLPPALELYQSGGSMERNTGWWLWRALLTSPHRTLSAADADFFFIPSFPMAGMNGEAEAALVRALRWVRLHAPHWNATEGHNHLVVGSWDFGLAFIAGRPEFSRLIQLSHFGWVNATRQWQTTVDGRCPAWISPAEREHASGVPDDPASCKSFAKTVGPDGGTHRMGIDIVIPDIMEQKFKMATPPEPNGPAGGRSTRVFFSGGATNVWRTEAHRLHANTSGWRVLIGHVDMLQEMTAAVFCLDVGGAGFSTRFTLAMVLGCVPVYLDELEPPWAGDLPLAEFSVRFSPEQLSSLPSLLDAIPAADVAALQAGVRRWRGSYHWRALFGTDGYSAARPAEGGGAAVPDALETLFRILSTRVGK